MFSLVTGLYESYWAPPQLNIVMVGTSRVGKTALLERIKVTQVNSNNNKAMMSVGVAPPRPLVQAMHVHGGVPRIQPQPQPPATKKATTTKATNTKQQQPPPPQKPQRRFFPAGICPAPERYRHHPNQEEDEEEVVLDINEDASSPETPVIKNSTRTKTIRNMVSATPDQLAPDIKMPLQPKRNNDMVSLQSLDLTKDDDDDDDESDHNENYDDHEQEALLHHAQDEDATVPLSLNAPMDITSSVDQKPNTKMLPFEKIRPTIGTNLAKLDVCGAKCHFFDVGGKMQNLWERYYDDCDAFVFVVYLGGSKAQQQGDAEENSSDDDAEDDDNYRQQYQLVQQVRNQIPDDVPFLILGTVFSGLHPSYATHFYTTDGWLPLYHNNLTTFGLACAQTGVGIQAALQWLIPLAIRQQKERRQQQRNAGGGKAL